MRRIAIVHDFLYTYAGAERVLEQMLCVYPEADLFSLFDFLPEDQRGFILGKRSQTTFIQRLPFAKRAHRLYLPLMPLAIEQLDVSHYELVISSSYVAAKGVITRPDQLHVCYCHSPVRFAWDMQHQYLHRAGMKWGLKSMLARAVLHYIRNWDSRSANGVDVFVTNSQFVGRRIQKIYRRSSIPIYPPVDVENFSLCEKKDDFYLTASRMVPYKRMDLVVEAFSRLGDRKLVVVGEGPEFKHIRKIAGKNVQLLGHQPFEKLKELMQKARAFVFAAEEDFGIVPVEAQACGTPVIAFRRGGATETVIDGTTGLFFNEQTAESLVKAVIEFESGEMTWDAAVIRANAERFGTPRFREEFRKLVESEWTKFHSRGGDQGDANDADSTGAGGRMHIAGA
jgi:glycosyltransferase involved in cell wall biosynthesis